MKQNCWTVREGGSFLISPDPISDLRVVDSGLADNTVHEIEEIANKLPALIREGKTRDVLLDIKQHDLSILSQDFDGRMLERAFQIYAHFANAYVWCENDNPTDHIPASVAVPLVYLCGLVGRPPILSYASTCLANYKRIDPEGDIVVDNITTIQKMIDIPDEIWFHKIHMEIENHAGRAINACIEATAMIANNDAIATEKALLKVPPVFESLSATFRRMFENCSPDTYYHTLRPYLFGFTDIVYQGVDAYGDKPMTFSGQSGAQSTVIPAFKAFLGIEHEKGGLTKHLEIMKGGMPIAHRELLSDIDTGLIRQFVMKQQSGALTDAYNASLESLLNFRTLHLKMASAYIAKKVENPIGTGGTDFMLWLTKLRDETAAQYI
ncbi:MAG: hypothetical protein HOH19_03620 [Kordiimonadaceae bacterium]|nr:hypothetical protein [Kordiimonadaceae bacterium]MBT6031640.1 hypothetical protein [Kordiimonadaceae bacterium]